MLSFRVQMYWPSALQASKPDNNWTLAIRNSKQEKFSVFIKMLVVGN
jgi:hypothetical protein